jgi:lysozyme
MTARDLIKQYEGLRFKAYPDPGSGGYPFTIGYGHTENVGAGDTCTKEQAEKWLDEDMLNAYSVIDRMVTVPISQNQRDALCSFIYNIGGQAFAKSTMLKLLNANDYQGAADQFKRWNKASGNILPGLVKRRQAEHDLFVDGIEAKPKEKPMLPVIATQILGAFLPILTSKVPELGAILNTVGAAQNPAVVDKVGSVLMQSTGATNMQEAVERIQADPQTAKEAGEALRANRADIADLIERMAKLDEDSVAAARTFSSQDRPVVGQWHFVHLLSLLFVILGGGAAIWVLVDSQDPSERVMALQTLLIVGFASVAGFWLGSSRSSQVKDMMREK